MSAESFVEWYWNLEVGATEWSSQTVSLNKYMIGSDTSSERAKARRAVLSAAQKEGLDVNVNAFVRANCGKVSPADCEHILSLALETELVPAHKLQAWADKNLGVDCTGFAVAYYNDQELIDIDKYKTGASCFTFFSQAKRNNRASDGGPLIWDLEEVQRDDIVLWMNEAQVETRKPGHIAVVTDVDYSWNALYLAESNGANDGHGHYGPKLSERDWSGVKKGAPRHVLLGKADKVVILRPPPRFG
jgi:hypothetical protein